ncbi:uncharacterized protein LOC110685179 [Chenopodium quinoa]|uniref:uncharacterized protein LOC110685179 n=1 Tax=Chenopodium quinoa TaxID=63459 RepID=UPI000B78C1C0|nr:uncharacterized protein LOC110685179 [Chenopodium quinoa]
MEDNLFDVYQHVESVKELWESLESKYMAEDASSKKFLVSNFNDFKFVDGRSIMDQFHEIQRIYSNLKQYGINVDELFVVSSIIDKLPNSWKDVKHDLKHKKEDISLSNLATHLQIEEGIRAMEKAKDGNPSSSTINVMEEGKTSASTSGKRKMFNSSRASPRNKRTTTSMLVGNAVRPDTARRTATFSRRKWRNPRMVKLLRARTNPPKDDDSWWMDSGASRHVCKVKHWFKTFHKVGDGEELFMRNNSTIMVQGRGQVDLMFSSGNSIILRDVLYAPSISRNLVSGPTLNRLRY